MKPRVPPHLRLGGLAAAAIAFIAPFEPNLIIRIGPALALIAFVMSNPHRFRIGATEWILLVFLGWAGASILWISNPDDFAIRYLALLSFAIMFIGIRAAVRWGRNLELVTVAFALGCFFALARTSLGLIGAAGVIQDRFGRITQVGDLNVNYVAYAAVFAVLLLVVALRTGRVAKGRARVGTVLLVAALVVGIASTQTRGAFLSLAFLALWLLISRRGAPLRTVLTAATVAAVAVATGWLDSTFAGYTPNDRTGSGLSGRIELWGIARDAWGDSPLVGIGLGATRHLNASGLPTHNTFLEIGATLGIIGLALMLLLFGRAVVDRLGETPAFERRFRIGAFVVAFLPIALSSGWEMTAPGWIGIALLSLPGARPDAEGSSARALDPDSAVVNERQHASRVRRH